MSAVFNLAFSSGDKYVIIEYVQVKVLWQEPAQELCHTRRSDGDA